MKRQIILIFIITLGICACLAVGNDKKMSPAGSKGFALVELFTSEGCSSCPPAEVMMHNLIHKADSAGMNVYVVEFHVDYWDYLGWKDTFAMPAYSQRQQQYSEHLKLNSVYTPQAIVNGESEMVGSDENKINTTVSTAIGARALVNIDCKANKSDSSKVEVSYTVNGNISGCELNIVIVESNLTTYVKKGENAHKTLMHDNVAKVFRSIKLNSASGKISMDASRINLSYAKVICYLQNIKDRSITGATQATITQ